MANQAVARQLPSGAASPKMKILRIGIIQGGRIVEERLVRKREDITIGQSAKNMFVVLSDALPRNWLLFRVTGSGYEAHFSDGMDARIAVGNDIISLSQLKQTGKIQKHGLSWVLPLDERARGKITLADMTILFQFVTPPPPQPRPQLPASVRGSALSGVDWFFTTIAALSFLFHLIFVIYLRNVDWPRKPDIEAVPDRFVQMVVKKEEKKPEPKKEEVAKTEEPKKEEKAKGEEKKPKKELTEEEKQKLAEAKAKADAERRARLAEQVKSTGLLKLLGAKSEAGGSIADVLGKGDVDRDQEKAFQGVGGVGVASADSLRGIKSGGSGSGRVADASSLRGGAGIAGGGTGQGSGERTVKGAIKTEAPAVDGELDPNMVAKEVRTRLGAIKACYERALKRNPNLSGKVVIHWTITQAGTVSGVDVEQDTLGDAEVASCIKSLIARWRFPAPSGGSVDVSFPFVFQASQ
ncbi:MAG TPA: AgmX/PglI C-terminal domain-containing protein [Polyangia bacterium]|nr:AgmX/PglI C-terminal domain-containing protein [Polyangia bacterium]